jgi:NAD(P)-dependent dehydrogenase (short-subunit alcohol dehydrogenase family)
MTRVFILGENSDIGKALAERYRADNCRVVLTSSVPPIPGEARGWDKFISCIGTMEPIGKFTDLSFEAWAESIRVNVLHQLRIFHLLYPHRRPDAEVGAMFFAGGGTNGPMTNYSAYCASKIFMIKMAELLDDECSDLNVFTIGPGFVKTKIHGETFRAKDRAGPGLPKTLDFMKTEGTSYDDIYACAEWCFAQGKAVAGGRNFSLVHDAWRGDGAASLGASLRSDPDLFKLRRRQ